MMPFPDDPDSYDMIRQGETIGVFQLESLAQRVLQARLRPAIWRISWPAWS